MSIGGIDFLLILPALILALIAQGMVKSTYAKYSRIGAASRITGAQVARLLLGQGGAGDVTIEQTPGQLTDHYDPEKGPPLVGRRVRQQLPGRPRIAAHETGHALQHHERYAPLMTGTSFTPWPISARLSPFPCFSSGF